jgi:hypothetical protein
MMALELIAMEHIRRNGSPFVMVNGLYDACTTFRQVAYNRIDKPITLHSLSSPEPCAQYDRENIAMKRSRLAARDEGRWLGYLVDFGQGKDGDIWVTEQAPWIHVLYKDSVTIHRVSVPLCRSGMLESERSALLFGGAGYLVPGQSVQVISTLSTRNNARIPSLGDRSRKFASPPIFKAEAGANIG